MHNFYNDGAQLTAPSGIKGIKRANELDSKP